MSDALEDPVSPASINRLTALSKSIDKKTRLLAEHLATRGLEAPSLERHGRVDFPVTEVGGEALQARLDILAMTKELHELVLGPREDLKNLSWDVGASIFLATCDNTIPAYVPYRLSVTSLCMPLRSSRLPQSFPKRVAYRMRDYRLRLRGAEVFRSLQTTFGVFCDWPWQAAASSLRRRTGSCPTTGSLFCFFKTGTWKAG